MANKFNMKGLEKRARGAMEASLILIGNEAVSHFKKSFRDGGFEDKTVEPWKPRKDKSKRSQGRAILVKSGDLKRSPHRESLNRTGLSVVISTDLPYAKRHNEGLDGMPKRQFMGDSYKLNEKVKKILTNKLDKIFK